MATPETYKLLLERSLQEKDAKLIYCDFKPILGTREMLRMWPLASSNQTRDTVMALDLYSSAKNYPKQLHHVTDPFSDRTEEYTGIWRVIDNRVAKHGEDEGVYQLLREGWATSLEEDEARFSAVQGTNADGTLAFTRTWPNINPTLVAALTATLKATASVTNPKLEGVEQTGTFASSQVAGQIMPEDGAGIVSQVLTLTTTIGTGTGSQLATALAARKYTKTRNNEILSLFNLETGEADTEALVFTNLLPADETKCMTTITDANLVSALASGWTYAGRNWKTEQNGTATFTVAFRQVSFNAWSGNTYSTYNTIDYTDKGRDGEQRSKTWELIKIADITTAVAYLSNDTNCDGGFHVLRVGVNNHRDGSCDLVQVSIAKVTEIASIDGNLTGQKILDVHGFHKGRLDAKESVYSNYSMSERASIVDPVPDGYKLVDKNPGIQGNGLYSMTFRYEAITYREWGKLFDGTASTDADTTEYENVGDQRTGITKTWTAIRLAHLATAVAALKNGTTGYEAESGYIITGVTVSGGNDGSFGIAQRQKKQVNGIDVVGNKLISPHSIQEGEAETTTTRYEHFTEASLPAPTSKVPGTDAGVISNEVEGPNGDGLFSRIIIEQTVTWNAWSVTEGETTTYRDPDLTEYPNAGTDREGIVKTWLGIDNGDLAEAIDDIRDGTIEAEDGYTITEARVRPGEMGSIVLTQVQVKRVEVDNTGASLIRPHAIREGLLSRVTTTYENFLEADLPAPTSKVPGTDTGVISNEPRGPDGNGLYSRVIVTETVTWPTWASVATSPDLTDYSNQGSVKERKNRTWTAFRKEDRNTAVSALFNAEAGYIVAGINVGEGGNGSVRITQVQNKIVTGQSLAEEEILQPHNFKTGTVNRIILVNEDLENIADAVAPAQSGYTKILMKQRLQGDGRYSVYVIYEKVTWNDFAFASHDLIESAIPEGGTTGQQPVILHVKTWLNVKNSDMTSAIATLWASAESNYNVDDVKVRNNRNGSVDLMQFTSYVNTSFEDTWSLASGTYIVYATSTVAGVTTVNGWSRYDKVWDYTLKYFTSESNARTWLESGAGEASTYTGSTVQKITPNAWRAVRKTRGTDKRTDWSTD